MTHSIDALAELIGLDHQELAFEPVPVKPRHDGWTVERQRGFILRLAICGCVSKSAEGVGMSAKSAYRLRERAGAESFAAAWDRALGWGRDRIADLAIERALLGETRPIYYRGRKVGENVRYDNRLMTALLNGERGIPDDGGKGIFRDRSPDLYDFQRMLDELDDDLADVPLSSAASAAPPCNSPRLR